MAEVQARRFSAVVSLIVHVGGTVAIGLLSALLVNDIPGKYARMRLPVLSPPQQVFPIAWTILYLMIGIAAFLIWRQGTGASNTLTLALYWVQVVLNAAWMPVFFNGQYWLGVTIVVAMMALTGTLIWAFLKASRVAAYLMVPYLAWLVYALYLSFGVAILN